jgi:sugar lactone lactonase YvrE
MTTSTKTLLATELASGLIFGEGPRWHDGRLFISDMLGERIVAIDAYGSQQIVAEVANRPNGLAFLPDGILLFTSMLDGKLYRLEAGRPVLHADILWLVTGYLGDMVVDDAGRAYVDDVGSRVFEGEPLKPGRLIIVERDGRARVGAEDLGFANGIAITGDRRTLIVAESFKQHLTAFDIEANGDLSNRRVYRDLSRLDVGVDASVARAPDGIAIDAEDALWISMPVAGKFARLDTHGAVTDLIDVGDEHPIACALGGADGRTLFMSSSIVARDANLFAEMANKRTRTHLLTARVDVPHGKGLP